MYDRTTNYFHFFIVFILVLYAFYVVMLHFLLVLCYCLYCNLTRFLSLENQTSLTTAGKFCAGKLLESKSYFKKQ